MSAGGGLQYEPTDDLKALEGLSGTGLVARTGSETYTERTITATANETTVSDGDGVSGNPTVGLVATPHVTGISFDSGSNTLGNYEEGTFTPTLTASSTAPDTVTYDTQTAIYTRIGNVVYFDIVINLATFTLGSGAGTTRIAGLPFTSNSSQNTVGCNILIGNMDLNDAALSVIPRVNSNSTNIDLLFYRDNAASGVVDISAVGASTNVCLGGFYFV